MRVAGVTDDGAFELNDAAREQIVKCPHSGRPRQQCEKTARGRESAAVVRIAVGNGGPVGAGAVVATARSSTAFGPGTAVGLAKLFDNEDGAVGVGHVAVRCAAAYDRMAGVA